MPHPKVKLSDDSGNTVGVTSNRLDVNVAGATMSTGDIEVNSEFPAAATIADDFANPDTTSVMSMLMGYDTTGTNWNRLHTNAGTMGTGTLRVTLATDDTHWGTVGTDADSDGTAHAQLRYISDKANTVATNSLTGNTSLSTIVTLLTGPYTTLGVTTYTEGTSPGNAIAAVRNDTLAALADTNNEFAPFQVDAEGALYTTHGMTGLASDDNDTVGTSAEKISGADGDVACKRIDIMAHPSNTGEIWVGDSAVTTNGGNGGIRLLAGDFYSMDIDNTGDVYVVATVDGENVCFNYYT